MEKENVQKPGNAAKQFNMPPWLEKTTAAMGKTGQVIALICKWIFRLRGLFMAVPVGVAAVFLAMQNMARLPEEVGINLLANGQYAYLVSRGLAVTGPLVITGLCLVMMFLSRRTIYPWVISIFSLILPWLIWITNVFPA